MSSRQTQMFALVQRISSVTASRVNTDTVRPLCVFSCSLFTGRPNREIMHANLLFLPALQNETTSCHRVNKHQTVANGHPTMQTIAQPANMAGRIVINVQNATRACDTMYLLCPQKQQRSHCILCFNTCTMWFSGGSVLVTLENTVVFLGDEQLAIYLWKKF